MGKYYGNVGYGISEEVKPGVWKNKIITKAHKGDVLRNLSSRQRSSGNLNDDVEISNEISILADPFANENFSNIKFVEYMGARWKVTKVDVQPPRLILSLGGVYND